VPPGWGNFEDLPGNFLLIPPGGDVLEVDPGRSDYIGVYTRVVPEDLGCGGPAPHVGRSPADIANWFTTQGAIETTIPRQVSVGGLHGFVLDIKLAKRSKGVCLIIGLKPSGLEHGVVPGLTMRLYLLSRGAGTLAIELDDVQGDGHHLDAYSSVVGHFRFGS
jgi:hypothetical protein